MRIPDPLDDLYRLLDEAGLNGSTLNSSKQSQAKIINGIRTSIAMKARSYILRRDQEVFNAGVHEKSQRGKTSDAAKN